LRIKRSLTLHACRWRAAVSVGLMLAVALAGVARAQTLTDIGSATPTPGPNDISQLSTSGNTTFPDGLNYYTDNQTGHDAGEPGQTFTTLTGSTGYLLTSLAFMTAGLDSYSGISTPQPYYLHIYSVSDGVAIPLQTNTSANFTFNDGDWLEWTGLSIPLAPGSTYAWSFGKASSTAGWEALAVASNNPYAGGEIGLFFPAGGAITFGSSHSYDAVFDIGLSTNTSQLLAGAPVVSPALSSYLGAPVTLVAAAVGASPLRYRWQMGDSSGSLTNIPNATNASLTVTPSAAGIFEFDFIVTNASGSATSSVVSVTVLQPIAVSINVADTMATMPPQGLGVCTAVYDNDLISSAIPPLLKAAGITALRFPGGSYGDIFNWETTTVNDGGYINTEDSFANFMNVLVTPSAAKAIITVNYGSNPADDAGGDPTVAAAWVADANVTNNYGIKYWEIGNEIYGNGYFSGWDWEYDLHYLDQTAADRVGQPTLSPAAYGTNSIQFINDMKAKDPTILCGVFFDEDHSAWNTSLLDVCGSVVDFVIVHWYPGTDTASTLAASTTIVPTIQETLSQLTNILGATKASQMKIAITETGAGTAIGAAVSLFAADNYLTWLENGIVNVDYQILHTDILQNNQTPGHAYYGTMMCHLLANVGDTFLESTYEDDDLRIHATQRQDGNLGVMLVNLSPTSAIAAAVNISGLTLSGSGTEYQFGLTNYSGTNDYPSWPVSTNTVSGLGNSFTVLVPAYTIIDLLIPTNTPPVLAAIGNQTVNVGQTVSLTTTATDTNLPTPTLTFSLLNGPSGATLTQNNNTSAVFNWQPVVSQANSTNPVSIKVTDNGTPPMSAIRNFSVVVNPLTLPTLSASVVNLANGQFSLTVSGMVGPDYAVQSSANLLKWNTVFETNSPAMPFTWVDTTASLTNKVSFYRVLVGPPLP
jgi:hypothetical protein